MDEFLKQSRRRMRAMTFRQVCLQALGGGLGAGVALFFVNHSWRESLGEAALIVLGLFLWAVWLRRD